MNKILKYLFVSLLVTGLMYSCKEDENFEEKAFFQIDENLLSLTYRGVGGVKFIDVKTNIEFSVASTETWCIPEIMGKGKDNLRITVEETDLTEERIATITITLKDGKTQIITVTQAGMPIPPPPFAKGDPRVAALNPNSYYSFENADDYTLPVIGDKHLEFTDPSTVVPIIGPGFGKSALTFPVGNYVKVPKQPGDLEIYTLMMDIRISELNSKYYALFHTSDDPTTSDAQLYIKQGGEIGGSNYTSAGTIEADKWYRVVVVADGGGVNAYKLYLNGVLVLTNSSGTYKNRATIKGDFFWLFADDDGEEGDVDCAGFAMWEGRAFTDDEVAELGDLNDIHIDLDIDAKVSALQPYSYYAFLDADDYTQPTIGSAAIEFVDPTNVTVASDAPAGKVALTFPEGNYAKVNKPAGEVEIYTLMMDVRISELVNGYYALFHTSDDPTTSDAQLYIKRSGAIGGSTYAPDGTIEAGKWYRIVVVSDGVSAYQLYLNGVHLITNNSGGYKNRAALKGDFFWMFADDDHEEGDVDCAGFAFWPNRALTEDEVADLGSL